jgi:hypothetical protein
MKRGGKQLGANCRLVVRWSESMYLVRNLHQCTTKRLAANWQWRATKIRFEEIVDKSFTGQTNGVLSNVLT